MIRNVIDILFGCSHSNYSFPLTAKTGQRRSEAASLTGTYVVCLDCGKEFAYDWQEMRVITVPEKLGGGLAEAAKTFASKSVA
jgi:hypothetical protein